MPSIRADLPALLIIQAKEFDNGQEVEVTLPVAWGLKKRDMFYYKTGNNSGFAEVVRIGETAGKDVSCVIRRDRG